MLSIPTYLELIPDVPLTFYDGFIAVTTWFYDFIDMVASSL